ncbi:ABC transporter permease, partial [Helicobacter pylori]|nr:ABC transporter permease [Helicobacter pylori]
FFLQEAYYKTDFTESLNSLMPLAFFLIFLALGLLIFYFSFKKDKASA